MQEGRVAALLRDARATVARPGRPETPSDALRSLARTSSRQRVRDALAFAEGNATAGTGSSAFGRLGTPPSLPPTPPAATTPTTTSLTASFAADSGDPILERVVSALGGAPVDSDDAEVLARLTVLLDHESSEQRLRAAVVLLRFAQSTGEDSGTSPLESAVNGVYDLCRAGAYDAVLTAKAVDPLVRVLSRNDLPPRLLARSLGAMRYLSMDPGQSAQKAIVTCGALPVLEELLRNILVVRLGAAADGTTSPSDAAVSAAQTAAIIRNLTVNFAHLVTKTTLPQQLLGVAKAFCGTPEVVVSVLSAVAKLVCDDEADEDAGTAVDPGRCFDRQGGRGAAYGYLGVLAEAVVSHSYVDLIVSRGSFALAALLSSSPKRQRFFGDKLDSFAKQLFVLFAVTADRVVAADDEEGDAASPVLHEADVNLLALVEALTVDATSCETGVNNGVVSALVAMLQHADIEARPAHTMRCLVALGNVSFHQPSALDDDALRALLPCLLGILFQENADGVLEATRAVANLSHPPPARAVCHEQRIDEVMLVLAQHADPRVAYNALGALINFSADAAWVHGRAASDTFAHAVTALRDRRAEEGQEHAAELGELIRHFLHNVDAA